MTIAAAMMQREMLTYYDVSLPPELLAEPEAIAETPPEPARRRPTAAKKEVVTLPASDDVVAVPEPGDEV